ncbi:GTP-binding protein [Candidatus Kryptonium thompsonii]|uniref:Probable GTP-binding protein EngB n=1 Tax=Candidatus Kryptonium thompsonii TaxID=1633631 RepID=A0A0P1LT23_9BACT|nr:ribosome biogenesis GTP-binding protein YihA/YsxC [Candidatus Kryptonium thompsoni]CUS76570.1 GTP-binding protein [Candidatus Kryptonium thompsoni]CUS78247.1 GTP-binding protein [Candidatus Kryptonium thompsoni]CUS83534.1 GTP-binding protein [Candidatus Kryptonium thompsoni]CUS90889.1 GTP-binding protein [Candidatus Kryptonium thompsoni]CUS91372.1 GTP-binding protein [Candidatus Kryptonium thompsoni]
MKITSARFVASLTDVKQLPTDGLPEIALVGRSNVGKSSLINKLCGKRNLAFISSTPGKTQALNYFLINESFYIVDLPGYGYARVPEHVKAGWSKLIENYLSNREQIKLVLHIVDARHEPTELDKMMAGWLDYFKIPYIIVITKIDKIARSKISRQVEIIKNSFGKLKYCQDFITFSAITGVGKNELLSAIEKYITTPGKKRLRSKQLQAT